MSRFKDGGKTHRRGYTRLHGYVTWKSLIFEVLKKLVYPNEKDTPWEQLSGASVHKCDAGFNFVITTVSVFRRAAVYWCFKYACKLWTLRVSNSVSGDEKIVSSFAMKKRKKKE